MTRLFFTNRVIIIHAIKHRVVAMIVSVLQCMPQMCLGILRTGSFFVHLDSNVYQFQCFFVPQINLNDSASPLSSNFYVDCLLRIKLMYMNCSDASFKDGWHKGYH